MLEQKLALLDIKESSLAAASITESASQQASADSLEKLKELVAGNKD